MLAFRETQRIVSLKPRMDVPRAETASGENTWKPSDSVSNGQVRIVADAGALLDFLIQWLNPADEQLDGSLMFILDTQELAVLICTQVCAGWYDNG